MSRSTRIVNISLPEEAAQDLDRQARGRNTSRSAIIREALATSSRLKELKKLQQYGTKIAEKLGLENYDDIETYFG
jgi:metal-responsive CopG/Arc/MetJ family transcriptional regulator